MIRFSKQQGVVEGAEQDRDHRNVGSMQWLDVKLIFCQLRWFRTSQDMLAIGNISEVQDRCSG